MNISRSPQWSIKVLLTFEMRDLNGALFLNTTSFSTLSFYFAAAAKRFAVFFIAKHASLYPPKSDLNIVVLNLKFLLAEYCRPINHLLLISTNSMLHVFKNAKLLGSTFNK